jgi:hypothetical protein
MELSTTQEAAAASVGDGYENMRAITTSKFIYKILT